MEFPQPIVDFIMAEPVWSFILFVSIIVWLNIVIGNLIKKMFKKRDTTKSTDTLKKIDTPKKQRLGPKEEFHQESKLSIPKPKNYNLGGTLDSKESEEKYLDLTNKSRRIK